MILHDAENMNLIVFGAAYFLIENFFVKYLVEKINGQRKYLEISEIEAKTLDDDIIMKKEEYDQLFEIQKYWVQKTELEFLMGKCRQGILLETLKMLVANREGRRTLDKTIEFLRGEYEKMVIEFKEQIPMLESLADKVEVISLSHSILVYQEELKNKSKDVKGNDKSELGSKVELKSLMSVLPSLSNKSTDYEDLDNLGNEMRDYIDEDNNQEAPDNKNAIVGAPNNQQRKIKLLV